MEIPITFEYEGKTYSGYFNRVSGAGSSSTFYLMIDKFYRGQLVHSDTFGWQFTSNDRMFESLSEYFGEYVAAYLQ